MSRTGHHKSNGTRPKMTTGYASKNTGNSYSNTDSEEKAAYRAMKAAKKVPKGKAGYKERRKLAGQRRAAMKAAFTENRKKHG